MFRALRTVQRVGGVVRPRPGSFGRRWSVARRSHRLEASLDVVTDFTEHGLAVLGGIGRYCTGRGYAGGGREKARLKRALVAGRELLRGPRYVLAMQCRPVVFLSVATLIDFPPYGNGDSLGREQVDTLYMGQRCRSEGKGEQQGGEVAEHRLTFPCVSGCT
jgi:hypothetical protein